MPSPFPGMDPYLERPDLWPSFHDSLVNCIRGALQPVLRPRYLPVTQHRLYVVEAYDATRADDQADHSSPREGTASGIPGAEAPAVFKLQREPVREPLIHIIDPSADNRAVTVIEVLSPANKKPGPGHVSYIREREEAWEDGTNLVEIDLLHAGEPAVRVSAENLDLLRPWRYLVAVTRGNPAQQEVYALPLQRRLPRIAIPLGEDDPDVTLDLQEVFTRCWEEGFDPNTLGYGAPPPGVWTVSEILWCEQQLRQAGYRSQPSPASA